LYATGYWLLATVNKSVLKASRKKPAASGKLFGPVEINRMQEFM
jgi:hypothetical protein